MFIAVTLRFGKNSWKIEGEDLIFEFKKKDIMDLHEKTQLNFIKTSEF